ncbi:MAG: aminotransferase class I/II-fold pyridoxal phosphate-dependent enzyme [Alphaproteobacteria bacterium]|jgi:dTDP-4-amino-4,6-dideoxygalactose transaminase|nr:aminotransferase class I/II-fold pyridoxal phosphate-dependent enzyme [Alphaproteobacteria bacterium]
MSVAAPPAAPVPFIDLAAQRRRLGDRVDRAIAAVLDHGKFIMGPEVDRAEAALAAFCEAGHCISCASGTDGLALGLMAWELRPGDAVLVPGFTFAATAEVVAWLGAEPVFVDVRPDSFNLDPAGLEAGIAAARKCGLRPRAVMAADLFGQPADYDAIAEFARAHDMAVFADAAQSLGARYKERPVGTLGDFTATSFYPPKPLGCYGDGGAVFTEDPERVGPLISLREHGYGSDKYDHVRIGMNARFDTIQAAILLEKLAIFPEEIAARQTVAARYGEGLADIVTVPMVMDGSTSVWAQYTIRVPQGRRAQIVAGLKARNVPTAVHYPRPLHRQAAFARYPVAEGGLPVAETLAETVLSLPMHPYLQPDLQDSVIAAVRAVVADVQAFSGNPSS